MSTSMPHGVRAVARLAACLLVTTVVQVTPAFAASFLDSSVLEKYVDPLPNPLDNVYTPVGTLEGKPLYEVSISQFEQKLHRDLPATTVWGYNEAFPGPTFVVDRGEEIKIRWVNNLVDSTGAPLTEHLLPYDTTVHGAHGHVPKPRVVTHVHGNITDEMSDGYPEHWFTPDPNAAANGMGGPAGNSLVTSHYNNQRAANLWYHDHAMGITRLNVYAGLAGEYFVRDEEEAALNLPTGPYEVAMVLQDRSFYDDGQLFYPAGPGDLSNPGGGNPLLGLPDDFPSEASQVRQFFGNANLVNGVVWPMMEVEPRKYRLRLLNGANSRFYKLSLDGGEAGGGTFHMIGTDGGLLSQVVDLDELFLSPADRADVIVDFSNFSAGDEVLLRNTAPDWMYRATNNTPADPNTTGQVMKFKIVDSTGPDTSELPTTLPTIERYDPLDAVRIRTLSLTQTSDEYGRPELLLNDQKWTDPITEVVRLGELEIWEFVNNTPMAHPMHLHMDHFQVLERLTTSTGAEVPLGAEELGWEDTAFIGAGETVRIMVKFNQFAGRFVWHCHLLEHEDLEMMRPFQIVAVPEPAALALSGSAICILLLAARRRGRGYA
jgi:spore coat protein A